MKNLVPKIKIFSFVLQLKKYKIKIIELFLNKKIFLILYTKNIIYIMKKTLQVLMILLFPLFIFGQSEISGKVIDSETKEPLLGVYVIVKDTMIGTVTDFDGNYTISVPKGFKTLSFSYVGYQTREVNSEKSGLLNIELIMGQVLEDVVVIGYGSVKREDVTGTLQSVSSDKFNRGAITGAQELIAGKMPGVTITPDSGPGSGAKIRIRGESSLSASNDPLIVIDGVPVDNNSISGGRNILNTINPNDIETMTVLKDASSSAIYGNRASAGVILITTKKSKVGERLSVQYGGNFSLGNITKKIEVLDREQYIETLKKELGDDHIALTLIGDANTNWQDQIFHQAAGHDHNLSIGGSVKKFPYRVSLGFTDKNGLLKTDRFTRYLGGININPQFFNNRLQVGIYLKGMKEVNRFADHGAIGNAIYFDPTQEPYDSESTYGGYYYWRQNTNSFPNALAPRNPVALLEQREDRSDVFRYITNFTFDYRFKFLPELRANLSLGYDHSLGEGTVKVPTNTAFAFEELYGGGVNNTYRQEKDNSVLEFYLNYKKEFGSHGLDIMGGYSWQHFKVNPFSVNSNVAGTPEKTDTFRDPGEYYLLALFGRMNYSFKNRYLLTFTLRRDGVSRFAPENRWGLFPSAALAVKVLENNNKYFNNVKFRFGWGITGQQDIGDYYAYLANYQLGFDNAQYQFGDEFVNTLRPNGYDLNIKWEESTTYNIGADLSMVKDKLSASLDVYRKNTTDLLNYIPVPAGTNLTNFITTNVGNMKSMGAELSLNVLNLSLKKLKWDFGVNFSYNKTEITKLLASADTTYQGVLVGGISGGVGSNIQIHSIGFAPNSFYVYKQKYDAEGKLLEGQFEDLNNDGLINSSDKYRYKKPAPDYTIGFTSSFSFYDFDLSFAGRANIGNYVYNNVQTSAGSFDDLYHTTNYLGNITKFAADLGAKSESNLTFSDHFVKEASFLKIDHITLSYNFEKLLGKSLKVYATAQNPFVFTKYDGLDPEIGNGIESSFYPRAKTYVFGLNVNF